MAVTNERLLELAHIYNGLKTRILYIDEKYSLEFVEPKLDMPDSLYLTKLIYEPKTEEELMQMAEEQVAASIISKQSALDKSYNTTVKSLANKLAQMQLSKDKSAQAVLDEYYKEYEALHRRLINNGLIFSTVATKYEEQLVTKMEKKTNRKNKEWTDKMALVDKEQQDAEQIYQERCADLEEEKAARIIQKYQKLKQDEEALARSIEKYNTGLDEKEAKYQASRAKAYEAARRAAYNRAYNNSKLYLEYGETGYRRMIEKEKYAVSQDVFFPLTREEGKIILSFDSFMVVHLGTYYSAFVDWVNTTLIP
ncbi:MAG: hypothetical protein J1G02_00485 [Clostridiales bacterium]|nr:hypothetical protein [Clostridiales bacterium]